MNRNLTVSPDGFSIAISGFMEELSQQCTDAVEPAVKAGCKEGVKLCRSNARAAFGGTGEYAKGFGYKIVKEYGRVRGEIGNQAKPGLVHLLECGHATIGGGFVPGRPHVAPAAEEAFRTFEDELDRRIDAIGS